MREVGPDAATRPDGETELELSIVMPCLDEAETVERCVRSAKAFLEQHGISGEVLVADNGSSDGSPAIALRAGARVVDVAERGYGSALMGGIRAARGRFVIMGDADASYDFSRLMPFVENLRAGYELVMGDRFAGGIEPGAMSKLHRYLGNPVLTGIGRLFFGSPVSDFHSGLRGFSRDAIMRMDPRTTGMEFASEIVVQATLLRMRITEVPIRLSRDGRSRPPHLRSWRDGWRHLRFLLLYSPRWLFLYPGLALTIAGGAVALWLLPGKRTVGSIELDIHTFIYAVAAVIVGAQAVAFALLTKIFAIGEGLLPTDRRLDRIAARVGLERGLLTGAILLVMGIAGSAYAFASWGAVAFGPIEDTSRTLRVIVLSMAALALGSQIILASFFVSILGLRRR